MFPGRVAYPAVTCTVDTDLLVVGGGFFGLWTAVVAKQHDLRAEPGLSVALLDREDFPRDKPCGDGIAPHVLDLLAEVGVAGIMHDQVPVQRLRLSRGDLAVDRTMARPAWVVPREIFDHRLVEAAQAAGAYLLRHRVRSIDLRDDGVTLDGAFETRVLVGADGAHSAVRRGLGGTPGPAALALRGYAPTPPGRSGAQVIAFGPSRQPSYAWSFDRGDGYSNVGYGESLSAGRARPTRVELMAQLDSLLPGATVGGTQWRGHHLPLSSWSWRPANGRVMLVGDAAGLINPMTGEGIYYVVATGILAGRAAAAALESGTGEKAGVMYRRESRGLLGRHLRHSAASARLCLSGGVLDAGIRASAADQGIFDDLVEVGLANGRITTAMLRGLLGQTLPGFTSNRRS